MVIQPVGILNWNKTHALQSINTKYDTEVICFMHGSVASVTLLSWVHLRFSGWVCTTVHVNVSHIKQI